MLFIVLLNAVSLFPEVMEGGFLVSMLLLSFLLSFLSSNRGRSATLFMVAVIALCHVLSVSVFSSSLPLQGKVTLMGKVVGNPGMTGKRKSSFDVKATLVRDDLDSYGTAKGRLHVLSKEEELYSGDDVILVGRILDRELFIAESVLVTSHGSLYHLKRSSLAFVKDRLKCLPENERELASRLLLASGDLAAYEISDLARDKGVSHVFALSGMHLELIFNFATFLLIWIPSDERRKRLVLIPLILFSFLSSFGASLLRALLMRGVKALFPDLEMDEVLCLSFLIHAYISPMMLLSAGGVLSYMSISMILFLSPYLEKLGKISSSILVTSGCLLSTGLYSISQFDSFTFSGLLYSPIVSSVVRLFMTLLLVMVAIPLPFMSKLLGYIYSLLMYILDIPNVELELGHKSSYILTVAVFIPLFLYSCGKKRGFGLDFLHCVESELRKHKRT